MATRQARAAPPPRPRGRTGSSDAARSSRRAWRRRAQRRAPAACGRSPRGCGPPGLANLERCATLAEAAARASASYWALSSTAAPPSECGAPPGANRVSLSPMGAGGGVLRCSPGSNVNILCPPRGAAASTGPGMRRVAAWMHGVAA
eukprot:scaffold40405_cov67-Phaeocystis_antarctica.AAC.3